VGQRVIRVLDDPAALFRAAAEEFVTRVRAAVEAGGACAVALAGGSTPRGMYGLLADPGAGLRARVPWEALHVFWGDERHVPPDHADSNYRMAAETLLSRVPVPEANIHRIRGEVADAEGVARAYEDDLRAFFGARGRLPGGWPRFDLCLLGMGPDGHTASLFPGTDAVHEAARLVAAPWVPKLTAHRITLTPPVFNAADAVVFVAAGSDKAAALVAVLEGERCVDLYPSQTIRPVHGELVWLVDRAAAAKLTR
jgi:6-phosphogluconolactonase